MKYFHVKLTFGTKNRQNLHGWGEPPFLKKVEGFYQSFITQQQLKCEAVFVTYTRDLMQRITDFTVYLTNVPETHYIPRSASNVSSYDDHF